MSDNDVKVKKAVYKRWWFWLIAIFIILIVISSSGGKDKSASGTNSDSGNSKSTAQTDTKYGLKQPVSVGDLVYTANSVKKQTTVGSGAFAKTSQSGTYVVTNLTVKNNGNETVTIDSSLFELTDAAGRTFKPSSEGQTAMMFNGKDNFFLKQVQPGLSATGDVVFEIPVDATGLKINVSAGLFSSKKATISLE